VAYRNSDGLKNVAFQFSADAWVENTRLSHSTSLPQQALSDLSLYTESPQDMTDFLLYFRYIIGQLKEKLQGSRGVEAL
jgi:hypothetical protein